MCKLLLYESKYLSSFNVGYEVTSLFMPCLKPGNCGLDTCCLWLIVGVKLSVCYCKTNFIKVLLECWVQLANTRGWPSWSNSCLLALGKRCIAQISGGDTSVSGVKMVHGWSFAVCLLHVRAECSMVCNIINI